ncbi:uncharacterized protein Tco025E_00296 [Trypanosoma conorhini]|uniref:Uncharacterized protein n=1 Tax=Trypanosoma conorhini TaxID=83891 RepID=A0A422QBU5_9TRYP|nr:uncharacterized protein Tco025E_00296 [Trypanosoma conorhini]RNF27434.1 hypothetical protein Tco025E_00296 [Trypanosoma conorhini]
MSDPQEGSIYARVAILQWAAEIFHRKFGAFGDFSASDIAVLLHAIFNTPSSGCAGETAGSLVVSLHDIQFCENPTPTTLFLNAKRVLSLVQTLSSTAGDGSSERNAADGCCGVGGCRPPSPPAVGNMTVSAWMEGKAFVEELKMWRWIRAEAFRRGLEVEQLELRVQAFLRGAAESGKPPPPHAVTAMAAAGRALGAGGSPSAFVVGTAAAAPRKRLRGAEEGATNASEAAPPSGVGGGEHVRALAAANMSIGSGFESGVRNHLHTDGVAQCAGGGGETTGAPPRHGDAPREIHEDALTLSHLTCDGVALAPRLLSVLEEVKKELEERKVVAEAATSAASGGTTGAATAEQRGSGAHLSDETRGSGCPRVGCSSCPAIFTAALQQNYKAIERLEAARGMAVAACLRRDAAALLEALSFL